MDAVREYCDRAIMIEDGKVVAAGSPDKVANDYIQLFNKDADSDSANHDNRWGDFKAEIEKIVIKTSEKFVDVSCELVAHEDIESPIIGLIIKNLDNQHILDSNNKWKKLEAGNVATGKRLKISWKVPNVFKDGKYRISIAAAHADGYAFYDWQDDVKSFTVRTNKVTAGLILLDDEMTIKH